MMRHLSSTRRGLKAGVCALLVGGVVALFGLAAGGAAAPAAPASWSAPADVPGTESDDGLLVPTLGFSPRGTGVLLTARPRLGGELVVPIRDGRVEPARELRIESDKLHGTPSYGVVPYDGSQLVAVGEDRRRRVFAAFGTLERGFSRVSTVGRRTRGLSAFTANGRGDVAIAFIDRQGLKLAVRPAGRRFRRPILIARARNARAVASNARGDVLVAWQARTRSGSKAVYARIVSARGRPGRARRLGPVAGDAAVSAALSPTRGALVAWQDNASDSVASVAYAPAGGRFRRPQILERFEAADGDESQGPGLEVAFSPSGEGFVVWAGRVEGHSAVRAATLGRTRFSPGQTLSAPGTEASFDALDPGPQLAIGPRGEAVVVWEQGSGPRAIAAAVRPAGATAFSPAETISGPGGDSPVAAIDPVNGTAFAFWIKAGENTDNAGIRYATRPMTAGPTRPERNAE